MIRRVFIESADASGGGILDEKKLGSGLGRCHALVDE
ncbi:MAG: hypothetical protein ACI9BH_003149, partial [Paracoccaceae bacterium]